jgi:hypothetical protein
MLMAFGSALENRRMFNRNLEIADEPPDAALARYLQHIWPHLAHEAGTLRGLCCLFGLHLWAQPDFSAVASRRTIHFCLGCSAVEIDGVRYS